MEKVARELLFPLQQLWRKPMKTIVTLLAFVLVFTGCKENLATVDRTPPAPPQGIAAYAEDNRVDLAWYPSQAGDVAGYNVYVSNAYHGTYARIATTNATGFSDIDAVNGTTYYYAITAFDDEHNESRLSGEDVHATPRPEGAALSLKEYHGSPDVGGYDFSTNSLGAYDDQYTDCFFEYSSGTYYLDVWNDSNIQDMGYTSSLDEISKSPVAGWSPTKDVRLIIGHMYVIETWDHHFAKVRVTALEPTKVTFDWAYQLQAGNPFLKQAMQTTRTALQSGSGFAARQ